MRLRTSFCNGTVLWKDLTRFAPLWVIYTIGLLVAFLLPENGGASWVAYDVVLLAEGMGPIQMIYAGICANVLFGDLYNARMCNAMHAMPLRRGCWFFTHVAAGLLFCLIPGVVVAAFLGAMCQEYFVVALLWLAVMTLEFVFFFGVGVFSVQCAGNRLGMAGVYLILNFFVGLVYVVSDQLYEPLLYGINLDSWIYKFLSPVIWLSDCDLIRFSIQHPESTGVFGGIYMDGWLYLAVAAAAGVALCVLAVVMYRKRQLESAGDLIAWKPLKPVFQVIFTVSCGALVFGMKELFGLRASYELVAIGAVVGFFVCRMLMERTVRVFRWKNFLTLGVFAVVFAASLFATKMDPLGVAGYVPEVGNVEFVRMCQGGDSYVYRQEMDMHLQAETPEEIEKIRKIHSQLLREDGEKTDGISQVEIYYKLKNGQVVQRYYTIDEHTAAYKTLQMYFSSPEYIFNTDRWEIFDQGVTQIEVSLGNYFMEDSYGSYGITQQEEIRKLLAALRADCMEGSMAQTGTFHKDEDQAAWLYINFDTAITNAEGMVVDESAPFGYLNIYPCNTHTIACLEEILEEKQAD